LLPTTCVEGEGLFDAEFTYGLDFLFLLGSINPGCDLPISKCLMTLMEVSQQCDAEYFGATSCSVACQATLSEVLLSCNQADEVEDGFYFSEELFYGMLATDLPFCAQTGYGTQDPTAAPSSAPTAATDTEAPVGGGGGGGAAVSAAPDKSSKVSLALAVIIVIVSVSASFM
jgi:hypothetical protein